LNDRHVDAGKKGARRRMEIRAAKGEEKHQRELAEAIASMMEGSYYGMYRAAALRLRLEGFEDLADKVSMVPFTADDDEVSTHDRIETVAKVTGWNAERSLRQSPDGFGAHTTFTLKRGRNTIVIDIADASGNVSHAYWLRGVRRGTT
jgi:hypothetical protein